MADPAFDLKTYVQTHADEAVARGWIVIYVTPVLRTMTGKVTALECFVRWADPAHGMLMPGQFLPALEEAGDAYKIDLCCIQNACRILQKRRDAGREKIRLILNLSPTDANSKIFLPKALDLLHSYDCDPADLILEVCGAARTQAERCKTLQFLTALHDAGFSVGIDAQKKAGQGQELTSLPLDHVKIDLRHSKKIDEESRRQVLSLFRENRAAGQKTLAVGVQSSEWIDYLKSIGCERVEGYAILTPMEYPECERMCDLMGLAAEDGTLTECLDLAEKKTDLAGARAICLLYCDQETGKVSLLAANGAFQELMKSAGVTGPEDAAKRLNGSGADVLGLLQKHSSSLLEGNAEHLEFYEGRTRIAADFFLQAKSGDVEILASHVWIVPEKTDEPKDILVDYLRATTGRFSILNFSRDAVQTVYYNRELDRLEITGTGVEAYFADRMKDIDPGDLAAYRKFTDRGSLLERLTAAKRTHLMQVFRTRDAATGSFDYVPMLHFLSLGKKGGDDCCYYCIYPAAAELQEALGAVPSEDAGKEVKGKRTSVSALPSGGEIQGDRQLVKSLVALAENEERTGEAYVLVTLEVPGITKSYGMAGDAGRNRMLIPAAETVARQAAKLSDRAVTGVFGEKIAVVSPDVPKGNLDAFLTAVGSAFGREEAVSASLFCSFSDSFDTMCAALAGKKSPVPESGDGFDFNAFDQLSLGVIAVGKDRRIVFWNRMAQTISGYTEQAMLGRPCTELGSLITLPGGATICGQMCPFEKVQAQGLPDVLHGRMRSRDGYQLQVSFTSMVINDEEGAPSLQVTFFRQETQTQPTGVTYQSALTPGNRDVLTGTANRTYLMSYLTNARETFRRDNTPFALLYVRLNGQVSDESLRNVGQALLSCTREGDVCGRYDENAFLVILKTKADTDYEKTGQRFARCIEGTGVTGYIGISGAQPGDGPTTLTDRVIGYAKLAKGADFPVVTDENAAGAALALAGRLTDG